MKGTPRGILLEFPGLSGNSCLGGQMASLGDRALPTAFFDEVTTPVKVSVVFTYAGVAHTGFAAAESVSSVTTTNAAGFVARTVRKMCVR